MVGEGGKWRHAYGATGLNTPTPIGAGILLSKGYLTDVRVCFCPGRNSEDVWSYDGEAAPSLTSSANETSWNPGLYWWGGPGNPSNKSINGGYLIATAYSVLSPTAAQVGSNAQHKANWGLAHRLGRAAGDTPMVLDIPWEAWTGSGYRKDGARKLNHNLGISCALFDGSAQALPDPNEIMERSFAQNSTIPGSGTADHTSWSGQVTAGNHDRWTYQPWGGNLGSSPNVTSPFNYGGATWDSCIAYIEHYYLNWDDDRIVNNTPDW